MPRVFAIGETVYDIIFQEGKPVAARPGGAMLNTAVSLGRLGVEPFLISEYGPATDLVGKIINTFLIDNQVNTDYVNRSADSKSTVSLAFLDEKNNASYSFYRQSSENRILNPAIDFMPDDIVLFGSIYSITHEVRSSLLDILYKASETGAIIIYDPNFRKPHLNDLPVVKPMIIENLRLPDIIRGSDEDFYLIFKANNVDEVFQFISRESNASLIYTQNRNGVDLFSSTAKIHVDVPEILPVSTIGAGDNFNAGIIWTLVREGITRKDLEHLSQKQWKKIISSGIRFATDVCMSFDNYISVEFAVEMLGE